MAYGKKISLIMGKTNLRRVVVFDFKFCYTVKNSLDITAFKVNVHYFTLVVSWVIFLWSSQGNICLFNIHLYLLSIYYTP